MTTYLIILCSAYLLSSLSTPFVQLIAVRIGALDMPGGRKIHSTITPRLGGLAVFLGFWGAIAIGVIANIKFKAAVTQPIWGLLFGSLIILFLGIYDDVYDVPAYVKFPFQVLAAVVVFHYGIRFTLLTDFIQLFSTGTVAIQLSWATSLLFTVLWITGITNAMNFVDGVDALAGGLCFIVSVTLFIVSIHFQQYFYGALYIALMGATAGFGKYNKYPATIFLGDTGSTFLGFALACISILGCHKSTALGSLLIPIVALGVPISDTAYAVFRRLALGKSIFKSDKGHIHHRLLELGYSPKEVVWIIYVVSIIFSFAVFFLINSHDEFVSLVVGSMTIGTIFIANKLKFLDMQKWESASTSDVEHASDVVGEGSSDVAGEGVDLDEHVSDETGNIDENHEDGNTSKC